MSTSWPRSINPVICLRMNVSLSMGNPPTLNAMRTPGRPAAAQAGPRSWIAWKPRYPKIGYVATKLRERRPPKRSGASGRIAARRRPRPGRRLVAAEAPRGEAREESIAMHAEAARGAALVPALPLERAQHVGLLEAVARLAEGERTGLRFAVGGGRLVHGQLERQVVEPDHRARGQRHAALDDVLELAHVTRPVVAVERHARPAREGAHVLLELAGVLAHKVGGQVRQVRLALPQRGHP